MKHTHFSQAPREEINAPATTTEGGWSRRGFLQRAGALAGGVVLGGAAAGGAAEPPVIPGLAKVPDDPNAAAGWKPISDRKLRVGVGGERGLQIRAGVWLSGSSECAGGGGE